MIACASSRGLRFAALASCSAALVAKSPCAESRVRSITGATPVLRNEVRGQGGQGVLHQPLNEVFQGLAVGVCREGRKSTGGRRSRRARNVNQYGCIFSLRYGAHAAGNGGMRLEARYVHTPFMKTLLLAIAVSAPRPATVTMIPPDRSRWRSPTHRWITPRPWLCSSPASSSSQRMARVLARLC